MSGVSGHADASATAKAVDTSATADVPGVPGVSNAVDDDPDNPDTPDDSDAAIAADWSVESARATHTSFGAHHHHCHLFEGATLAAAMAVAMLQWAGDTDSADAPLRTTGRSHASAVLLPFDSRAPPVAV